MNWNIVICDDEELEFRTIRGFLHQLEAERNDRYTVRWFSDAETMLETLPDNTHILLMDIGMDGITGMEASRILRERGNDVCLIFITSLTQYALEGYSVHAFGFLRKPLSYEVFRRELEEAFTALENRAGLSLMLPVGGGLHCVDFAQVCYVEVYGRLICITRQDGETLECRMSLSDLEKKLNQKRFFRCHNNYLVNFAYVDRIESKQLIMKDKRSIPVSKYRYQDLISAISRFARTSI